MARAAIRSHPRAPPHGHVYLTSLPTLSPEALAVYEGILPERLKQFPDPSSHELRTDNLQNKLAWHVQVPGNEQTNITTTSLKLQKWYHDFRHDAESVFWLLVWWAVHIRDPDDSTVSTIPNKVWDDLIGVDLKEKKDSRSSFLVQLEEEDEGQWLDPHYQGLDELFRQMALQLSGDYRWATHSQWKIVWVPH
jgi:hypothetical protein